MKLKLPLGIILLLFFAQISRGDIAPPDNSHYVDICVKITNIDDYPEISLLGYTTGVTSVPTYSIAANTCLDNVYKFNTLSVYAVKKSYINGKDITTLDLANDKNAVASGASVNPYIGFVDNSNPMSSVERYFKIMGFTSTEVVLFKWKEVTKYNDGTPEKTETYTYSGDVSALSQKILTVARAVDATPELQLFPNPTSKSFHVKMTNNYRGTVLITLVSGEGKVIKTFRSAKTASTQDTFVKVDDVKGGRYSVSIQMGSMTETRELVLQ